MIPHEDITPGYYWATYGREPATIILVAECPRYNPYTANLYNELKVMFHGLSARYQIETFTFLERINEHSSITI